MGNVTDDSLKVDAEIAGTYSHLRTVLFDFVGSHLEEMRELAISDVKPDETYGKIGKNDFYSADDLKTIYRNKAKDVVQELSETSFKLFGDNRDYKFRTALEAWSKKMK